MQSLPINNSFKIFNPPRLSYLGDDLMKTMIAPNMSNVRFEDPSFLKMKHVIDSRIANLERVTKQFESAIRLVEKKNGLFQYIEKIENSAGISAFKESQKKSKLIMDSSVGLNSKKVAEKLKSQIFPREKVLSSLRVNFVQPRPIVEVCKSPALEYISKAGFAHQTILKDVVSRTSFITEANKAVGAFRKIEDRIQNASGFKTFSSQFYKSPIPSLNVDSVFAQLQKDIGFHRFIEEIEISNPILFLDETAPESTSITLVQNDSINQVLSYLLENRDVEQFRIHDLLRYNPYSLARDLYFKLTTTHDREFIPLLISLYALYLTLTHQ